MAVGAGGQFLGSQWGSEPRPRGYTGPGTFGDSPTPSLNTDISG